MSSVDGRSETDSVTTAGGKVLPATALQSPAPGTRFVINLTSSTTPVALKQPAHPGLKRFTFFVSRRLEEGRERFRMHMGYFASQEEAEGLLDIVREIYPGAWAGAAPGMRLRAGTLPPIAGPSPVAAPAPAPAAAMMPPAPAAVPPAVREPAVVAAPATPPMAARVAPAIEISAEPRVEPRFERKLELSVDLQLQDPPPPHDAAAGAMSNISAVLSSLDDSGTHAPTLNPLPELKPVAKPNRSLDDAQVLRVLETSGSRPSLQRSSSPSGTHVSPTANSGTQEMPAAQMTASGTYATLQATTLSDNDATLIAPSPGAFARGPVGGTATVAPQVHTAQPVHSAAARSSGPPARAAAPAPRPVQPQTPSGPDQTANQPALKQAPVTAAPAPRTPAVPAQVAMGQPGAGAGAGAGAEAAAAAAASRRDVAAYAVQLMWSVQPIRVDQVAQLAIFSAYTLYAAEGNRDGRRWYGLRLGFFTDPISARQVAQYVRSEFTSVSVVPVTERERARAGTAPVHPTIVAAKAETDVQANTSTGANNEYRLLEDSGNKKLGTPVANVDPRLAALARIAKPLPPGAPGTSGGKRAKQRIPTPAQIATAAAAASLAAKKEAQTVGKNTRPRRAMTLEETLEILGADKLEMTEDRGELLSESGVRHMSMQAVKAKRGPNSRISRLFERLSEKMGGN